MIRLGLVDAAVVGGVDTLCGSVLYGFNSLELVSPQPCRPFDAARDGISLGEAAGFALLGTIDDTTSLWVVGGFMALIGLGIGATMQNLVLAVQNNTAQADMGAAIATVAFFRSMGGAVGVSALGALLNHQVSDKLTEGLARLGSLPCGG